MHVQVCTFFVCLYFMHEINFLLNFLKIYFSLLFFLFRYVMDVVHSYSCIGYYHFVDHCNIGHYQDV